MAIAYAMLGDLLIKNNAIIVPLEHNVKNVATSVSRLSDVLDKARCSYVLVEELGVSTG
jgi:hypothetical protein